MELKLYRGVWCAVWNDPARGTQRRSLRTKDRGAAERLLADLNRAQAVPRETVGQILDAYSAEKASRAGGEGIRYAVQALKPHFAHLRPDQVTRETCRSYALRRRKAKRKNGTIIKELSTLRAALNWQDKHSPAVVELPAAPPARERHLSREEYARLKAAARRTPHVYLFVVLALSTAARAGALLDLTWDRVDFHRGLIRLHGGSESRQKGRATVPMTDAAREALVEARRAAVTDYVIEYGGRRVGAIKKAFERAVQRAGLQDVTPHVLRHTAAVWMAEAGSSMPEIAAYLGHSDSRITERVYARFSPTFLKRAAAALEA